MIYPSNLRRLAVSAIAGLLVSAATFSRADDRRFTYNYETTTSPKGAWEFEQWLTWKAGNDGDTFDFRHELEYGVTDNLQLGLYLSDWRLSVPDHGSSEADWKSAGAEVIYSLTDPTKDWLGTALYGELAIGPEKFALEGKLLLQKNIGPLTLVYNFVLEAEWEGEDYDEKVGVIKNTVGLSYQISPSFFVGAEALHEIEFENWSDAGEHVVYVGPNVSFRKGKFFATVTGLFQATGIEDEPDHQVRMIAGFNF